MAGKCLSPWLVLEFVSHFTEFNARDVTNENGTTLRYGNEHSSC